MTCFAIARDDLTSPDVLDLLRLHLDEMHSWSPACKVHALPPEKLRAPDVTFYALRDGDRLAAVGALKVLGEGRGELKSMRAAPDYRGRGAGRALLEHLIAEARTRGLIWLGLETGRTAPFLPALRLYESHGFAESTGFGDYVPDEFSLCMELHL
ncbi:GNAT family N-acetyltransferase [Erythrobacter sp.]|jgi:putative acetyltransferase|uniref:GNAT family N-acetyltransferase n=1 Tax=Erythrobacter sp. TaxID=1042 RepID=UPI002EB7E2C8|nr:GNAT family N-acetyltransferase [Erythrobacter sp.]